MRKIPETQPDRSYESLQLHGVLVSVFGTGVLIIGESGMGKSECALDLIRRHHRLVADDVVVVTPSSGELVGSAPEITRELIEIRGLGIINVRELFGHEAIAGQSTIDLCVELKQLSDPERIGSDLELHEIAGHSIPKFTLPVASGRNPATLVETAVRVFLARRSGENAAGAFVRKHTAILGSSS